MKALISTRIDAPHHPLAEEWWALYEDAFPPSERRARAMHSAALSDPLFYCMRLSDACGFVGVLSYWKLGDLVYVEHLAITPSRRGGGLGRAALSMVPGPVVLEIEPVVDALTAGRLAFYESCGFVVLPMPHVQPAYQAGQPDVPLLLLSRPMMDAAAVARFEQLYMAHPMRYRDSVLG